MLIRLIHRAECWTFQHSPSPWLYYVKFGVSSTLWGNVKQSYKIRSTETVLRFRTQPWKRRNRCKIDIPPIDTATIAALSNMFRISLMLLHPNYYGCSWRGKKRKRAARIVCALSAPESAWHNELGNHDSEQSASSTLLIAVATYSHRREGWLGDATPVKLSTNSYATLLQTPGTDSAWAHDRLRNTVNCCI